MSAFHDNALIGASGQQGYQISRSVRLRSSASAYFNRTPASAGNRKTWTWSGWVKRGSLSATQVVFGALQTGTTGLGFGFQSTNTFFYSISGVGNFETTALYRDPSAWYHIVFALDSTQATQANRAIVYINGVNVAFATNGIVLNNNYDINNTVAQYIGQSGVSSQYLDGYLTEINFIDGQALTPSSFGETNAITGVWQPKKYGGTYGTNGFYLNFSDNSAVTTSSNVGIGKDFSGNGNYWTSNSISVTAGATYDSMIDVPTPYADGGNGRGNYCTLNPLDRSTSTNAPVPTNGNLAYATASVAVTWAGVKGTISFSTGKYYFEDDISSLGVNSIGFAGWTDSDTIAGDMSNYFSKMGGLLIRNDSAGIGEAKMVFGTTTSFASGADATNGLFQLAIDFDAGKFWIGKNNTWFGSGDPAAGTNEAGTFTANRQMTPLLIAHYATTNGNITHAANFGQRPFSYTPPTGFKALNTQNLPAPTISNGASYMAATTYTGTGSALTIANTVGSASFQPDLVWVKSRSTVENNFLFDSVRGSAPNYNYLSSNLTNAEATPGVSMLTAINSNGFTLGTNGGVNTNAATFVGWQWNAGGSTVTNTSGSISAQVRANATAGFSVVTYTGTGTAATIGHGLGVAPSMMIIKSRPTASTSWIVYHSSISPTNLLTLQTTAAQQNLPLYFNSTAPTSSVFSIGSAANTGTDLNVNGSTYVAYCFAAVAGYSAFGSYTGNGSADGVFVFLGLRARFLMIKRTDSTGGWVMLDTARDTYNDVDNYLYANSSAADAGSSNVLDINSNGFKIRNSWTDINASGGTYVYMAFCENPFKFSNAR